MQRDELTVADPPPRPAAAGRGDADDDGVARPQRAPVGAQILAQPDAASFARAGEHQVDGHAGRWRRVERARERHRNRYAACVVVGARAPVGAGEIEQQGHRDDQADGRDDLHCADGALRDPCHAQDRCAQEPCSRHGDPGDPTGRPVTEKLAQPGRGCPERVAVCERGAAGVVVGRDDQPDGVCGLVWRGGDHVLAGMLEREAAAERYADGRVGDDRDERDGYNNRANRVARDRDQAAGDCQRHVPRVRQRRVRATPERLDPDVAPGPRELVAEPYRCSPFGIGARPTPLEAHEPRDSLCEPHALA